MLSFLNIAPASRTSGQAPARRKLRLAAILGISVLLFILNGCGESEGPVNNEFIENWIVNASPNSFTVAAGESFEVEVRAEYTSGSSGGADLSLVEPSPSGAPFDSTVATISGECSPGEQPPPRIHVIGGEGFCTVVIHIKIIAPPGNYEMAIRGAFDNTSSGAVALDDSNPISVTVEPPSAGWHVVQGVSANFNDLDCPSTSVCYAVGEYQFEEVIYRTIDGGRIWTSISTGAKGRANAVQFLDESTGYIGGYQDGTYNGYLMKTTDGGNSWTDVSTNMPANLAVRGIHFLNADQGYAVGHNDIINAIIMYTSDGGDNWTKIDCSICSSNNILLKTYFWTQMEGYISATRPGGGLLYYTTNGGEDWNFNSGNTVPQFRDVSRGLAVTGGGAQLYSTTQPGSSWDFEDVPDPDGGTTISLEGVTTEGGRTWVAGRNGGAFVSYKDGGTWTVDWNPGQNGVNGLIDIEMFNATEGVAIGGNFMAWRVP